MRYVFIVIAGVIFSFILTPIGGAIIAGVLVLLTAPKRLTPEQIEAREKYKKLSLSKRIKTKKPE
jgi:phosphate/sulfate permease